MQLARQLTTVAVCSSRAYKNDFCIFRHMKRFLLYTQYAAV